MGPMCLLTCLAGGKTIPNFSWPIFNVAMIDCIVTSSYFPKKKKMEMKEKIELMGGIYIEDLTENCTHLVTDTVNSEKYIVSIQYRDSGISFSE